ncbi:hypothetical protein A3K29_03115 [Candidatus Collierbacteria bacterium RIFOXYB2_FULL_46_14]|uniref:Glycosyl transferase family 39 n=1 Tax=Candidatus Collierbacteria bacterium GW2011_GWA2_46_26 TaxID=1618381 RepID=A0A0G1SKJ3_9BACT|nr:MAG: Glycosyl transferase family 39 [Candidatus Collierbacteria bacterium GW2011_GWC2_44_13]KKU33820.1 MAG: Glycosyl transferase family 39 [Candidatus Collierbacteria bacterium GW2011_GWA2_46_26]OGD73111.1 MAG: hypothetical protein A3K29_03115 [Candidatus Collierbacteria bacterium RIFOXYB2_FULL_46_14]OGD76153.1 MAG: hypothetical protein A3K43_03115 [Candidatus Collierbacteria bacterium RIFOXYA2_FULL_46_20]OGD77489.1 MAG: hypothetical protein A3K39_03115 [Candidatus Collierbacteria bacterium 
MKRDKLAVIVVLLGTLVRFFRLPELASFSYEQALALEASGQMVQTGKLSLIGVEYFIRQTSTGHSFFNSAFYLYPLAIMQKLFGFDPLVTTVLFTVLNILSGIGLYLVVRRYFTPVAAKTALTLFMFSPIMVNISRSIWHVYLLVPVTVCSIWLLYTSTRTPKPVWFGLLGVVLGFGFGLNISYVLALMTGLIMCSFILYQKHKLGYLIYLLLGMVLGNLPTVIFDLRHNFYNTYTFATFLSEMFSGTKTGFSFEPYHFLYFLIPIFILISIVITRQLSKRLVYSVLALYVLISIPGWHLTVKYPQGMPDGTNLQTLRHISSIISQDSSSEFEVAAILDGETRAENLRYFLTYVDHKLSMSADKYPEAKTLYVVSYLDQDPLTKSVWELDSIKPAKVAREWNINELIKLTKLEKL